MYTLNKLFLLLVAAFIAGAAQVATAAEEAKEERMTLTVVKVDDFEVTGDGASPEWEKAEWHELTHVSRAKIPYQTRTKVAYSDKGIYFLVDCEDKKLTVTMTEDFDKIYTEDVVEVFLWTNEEHPVYFEYEISPLNVELPILVSNNNGHFMGWLPWQYEGDRLVRRATAVRGGEKESMAEVEGWSTEFFIPFALLRGLGNVPPKSGTQWRANIYRIDYDEQPSTQWAWCPDTGGNFHNFRQFGIFKFE